MKNNALFIVVEGGDGSGKGTQIGLLKRYLSLRGYSVALSREPGGSEIGDKIRRVMEVDGGGAKLSPEAEMMLFIAGRFQHVQEVILPFVEADKPNTALILDRYFPSTWAYQMCARGLVKSPAMKRIYRAHVEFLRDVRASSNDRSALPDVYFLLDLDPEVAERRLKERTGEQMGFDQASEKFKINVRTGLGEVFRTTDSLGFVGSEKFIINADGTPEEVHEKVKGCIDTVLNEG